MSMYVEENLESPNNGDDQLSKHLEDEEDGIKRTGTVITATAHIIAAVLGSGVLSLAWALAQLGWITGPAIMIAFAFITYFTATLLADANKSQDPRTGKRICTYMDLVKANLGSKKVQLCGWAQCATMIGLTIGYTITASISMVAVKRSNCFHKNGHHAKCEVSNYPSMIAFGCIEIFLSQIPNFHKLSGLSTIATIMSFSYASIGVGLAVAKVAGGTVAKTTLTGVRIGMDATQSEKIWRTLQAIADIAFSFSFAAVLVEIQNTLKSNPPPNKVMKKASLIGVSIMTMFNVLCGCVGYAAFGNTTKGNLLTGFGFFEPFWLVDFANACIAVHLICAYQVFCQIIHEVVEKWCSKRWPENKLITSEYSLNIPTYGVYNVNIFRLIWRTTYVVLTTLIAMIFPFFNDFVGLIGSISFWPLAVYFPIEMHMAQNKLRKFSLRGGFLQIICWACLLVSLFGVVGSIQGLAVDVRTYKPFKVQN